MKWVALIITALLAGCSTPVPVKQRWPESPTVLMERCPPLKQMTAEQNTMRDLLMTVIENYAVYYSCSDRVTSWQDWYNQQKKIFEESNR